MPTDHDRHPLRSCLNCAHADFDTVNEGTGWQPDDVTYFECGMLVFESVRVASHPERVREACKSARDCEHYKEAPDA